jgi:hypothetical protein
VLHAHFLRRNPFFEIKLRHKHPRELSPKLAIWPEKQQWLSIRQSISRIRSGHFSKLILNPPLAHRTLGMIPNLVVGTDLACKAADGNPLLTVIRFSPVIPPDTAVSTV